MQFVETISKIRNLNWKKIENVVVFTGVIFFMMSIFNILAVEQIKVDVLETYGAACLETAVVTNDSNPNKDCDKRADLFGVVGTVGQATVGFNNYVVHDEASLSQLTPLQRNGVVGAIGGGIASLIEQTPQVDLVAHLGSEWLPGYDSTDYATFAADNGYESLMDSGIDGLWSTVRNLAYILFVIVLIVAGFMIMFRQKIGGQLAVSVFNVIPRVITNLVLVTFSFAIVGVIIDMGSLLVRVIDGVLTTDVDYSLISVAGPFSLFKVFVNNTDAYLGALFSDVGDGINNMVGVGITGALGATTMGVVGFTVGGTLGVAAAGLVALLVPIIVGAIVGWASIKVYITLLKAYVGILIDTVMGPLYIAMSTIPGSNQSGEWFKRILKNVMTFPLVYLFINLGMYLILSGTNIVFPSGLTEGNLSATPSEGSFVGLLLKFSLVIVMFFIAAESPKFLEDIFPAGGGKGAAAALEGAREGMKKVPLIGAMF